MRSSLKLAILLLMLGVVPVQAEPKTAPPDLLTLFTQFEIEAPAAVLESFQSETESIMGPAGMHLDWRSLRATQGNEMVMELAVVTVKGHCDAAGLGMTTKIDGALGWTHVSDGHILPFVELDCDRLRNFIQKDLWPLSPEERESAIGRALGRVLAHELYHVLANTSKHGSGVSKESYTVHDLLTDDFQFQHKESLVLRAGREAGKAAGASM